MSDRTTDPTLRELLDAHSEAWFSGYHAPILGRVQTYTAETQLADVEPLVLLRVEGVALEKSPILRGVPVAFPGGSVTSYTWPLNQGDPVELIPQDADFGAYWASGTIAQLPESNRRMSLSDCIAVPVASRSQASPLPATAWAADGGVLSGLHYVGGSDATKAAALDGDIASKSNAPPDQMQAWMLSVELGMLAIPYTVNPSATTFTQVGKVNATATKLKVK